MQQLPILHSFSALCSQWKAILDQLLVKPIVDGNLLTGIILQSGNNTINHKLGRQIQGWIICDINAAATIYRSAWSTEIIVLNSSAKVTVNLWVF
jgi:hypothetical protein